MDELKVRRRKCDSTSPRAYINQLLAVVAAAARPTLGLLEETAIRFVSAAQCSIARWFYNPRSCCQGTETSVCAGEVHEVFCFPWLSQEQTSKFEELQTQQYALQRKWATDEQEHRRRWEEEQQTQLTANNENLDERLKLFTETQQRNFSDFSAVVENKLEESAEVSDVEVSMPNCLLAIPALQNGPLTWKWCMEKARAGCSQGLEWATADFNGRKCKEGEEWTGGMDAAA